MKHWILVNVDSTGLMEIQLHDEHPDAYRLDHETAVSVARCEAVMGDSEAQEAVRLHDRDAQKLFEYRMKLYHITLEVLLRERDEELDEG